MHEETLDVRGQRLRLQRGGDGSAVVFLHGAGGANWTPLHERLAAGWQVIAPEHPGFGRSEIPEWMMSVGDLAFFYLDMLDRLDAEAVHLVGHSLGGWLAAEIAVRSTKRIKSLSLMAPAGVSVPDAPFDDIFLWTPEEGARRNYYNGELAEARIAAQGNVDMDLFLQNRAGLARLAWSPRLENPQLHYWLHRIDVPTLLIWGREDRVIPYACHKPYVKAIPQAQLVTLDECGHASHTEAADRVGATLNDFFRSSSR
jgi:pimeloyl-ACP methyl ester carboxylesterase